MKTDNLSFTSKNLVWGKAPELKELNALIFEKIAAREAKFANRKHVTEPLQIRITDLANDRFDYERKILYSTGPDDVKEWADINSNRTIQHALGKKLPKRSEEFKLPDVVLDAKALIDGIKNSTIDIIELLF